MLKWIINKTCKQQNKQVEAELKNKLILCIIISNEFFTPALADGLSLEFKW